MLVNNSHVKRNYFKKLFILLSAYLSEHVYFGNIVDVFEDEQSS